MIKLNNVSFKQLHVILPNTNKALAEVLKSASPQELQRLSKAKDLGSVLHALLKQSLHADTKQNQLLLDLLKNNPTLKNLTNTNATLKELLHTLRQDKTSLPLEKTLEKILTNIQDINPKELKTKLKNSGVFLEANIKNATNPKEVFASDLKAVLLKAHEELSNSVQPNKQEILKAIDKLLLQIDYNQLISHLQNSASLYIPYRWDALEEGNITLKNAKNDKFFCDIHLQLKEYGELDLRLALFEKNQLTIHINTQNEKLKSLLQQNLPSLKKQLYSVNIVPKAIRFTQTEQNKYEKQVNDDLEMGFEVKV
ncbi:flagellar hook-length control protein FliK [Sulfurimonas sp. SWIR-19]|uniref:flagellar hook-length control protein FliK n=1 Tax=Sulfurimonas sp. SWIR-19 TaxID=2878390 RepID=UPI001CF45DEA|nr:flagellar hook-length control protein FliK [Sulfurimonas sp. SWIR-19]UCN01280.1 flagellar hook-length control protein FliK [Sulfurimonas sp. SWIR-19]